MAVARVPPRRPQQTQSRPGARAGRPAWISADFLVIRRHPRISHTLAFPLLSQACLWPLSTLSSHFPSIPSPSVSGSIFTPRSSHFSAPSSTRAALRHGQTSQDGSARFSHQDHCCQRARLCYDSQCRTYNSLLSCPPPSAMYITADASRQRTHDLPRLYANATIVSALFLQRDNARA